MADGGIVELPDFASPKVLVTPRQFSKAEEERRQRVPRDVEQILRNYFGFRPRDFHVKALQKMLAGGKFIFNWPTDFGKSITGMFHFPILSLMHDPNSSHILCGATSDDSARWLTMIKGALEPNGYVGLDVSNEPLLRDYPWIAKPPGKGQLWTHTEINVRGRTTASPNPSILATSWGASDIKGRRGKLIMDDLEGLKQRNSPTERERLFDWIQYEAIRNWEDAHESDRPLQVMLGTPFYLDSIYFKLETAGWETDRMAYKRWECNCEYCQGDPGKAFDNDHGVLRWPEKKEKVEELRKRYSKEAFAIAMKMDPRGSDKSLMTYTQITALAAKSVMETDPQYKTCATCNGSGRVVEWLNGAMGIRMCPDCEGQRTEIPPLTLVCLDPAAGTKTRWADYAGISVTTYRWTVGEYLPRMEVLEAHTFPGGLHEQCQLVSDLARQYGQPGQPLRIIFEGNAQQGGVYRETFKDFHPDVQAEGWWTTKAKKVDKELGLTVLRTLLKEQRLLVPASKHNLDGMQALFREIRDLGRGEHDHIAMSVWIGMRWTYEHNRIDVINKVAEQIAAAKRNRAVSRHFGYDRDWRNRFGWGGSR